MSGSGGHAFFEGGDREDAEFKQTAKRLTDFFEREAAKIEALKADGNHLEAAKCEKVRDEREILIFKSIGKNEEADELQKKLDSKLGDEIDEKKPNAGNRPGSSE